MRPSLWEDNDVDVAYTLTRLNVYGATVHNKEEIYVPRNKLMTDMKIDKF